MRRIQQGLPQQTEVVSLLNDAYDGWGDQSYFRWKYEQYPGYNPETQTFYSRINGDLASFRRVFRKETVDGAQTNTVVVLGDTAVNPTYQGEGLYSDLHAETVAFSRDQGVDRVSTFNRKTNLTFTANQDRGWQYRELPLKIRLLSPDVVLGEYTDLALPCLSAIETFIDRIGDRFHIQTSNGPVSVRDCISAEAPTGPASRSVGLSVSDRTLVELINLVCSADSLEPLSTLVDDWVSRQSRSKRAFEHSKQAPSSAYQVHHKRNVSSAEFDAIVDLYERQTASFRRTPADIRHILQYPDADIILVTQNEECVGYAVVGLRSNGRLREGRVLEFCVGRPEVFDVLITEIERIAVDREYDIILVFADRPMDDLWASVDQQVVMWRDLDSASPPIIESCRISLYDVV